MQRGTRLVLAAAMAAAIAGTAGLAQAAGQYLQCVPFARQLSGIQIFGDAYTWWRQADGKYQTGGAPTTGAVLVFRPHGSMSRGHVAVVSNVLTERIIQVDHANWSRIDGRRGQAEEGVIVVDVSDAGDWSQVKVWYEPIEDLGTTVYPTYGFIYQDDAALQVAALKPDSLVEGIEAESPGERQSTPLEADPLQALIQQAALSGSR